MLTYHFKLNNMSKFKVEETIEENINRLQYYYDDTQNGLNKCFLLQRINELKKLKNNKNFKIK
jgi:hypothetical protein